MNSTTNTSNTQNNQTKTNPLNADNNASSKIGQNPNQSQVGKNAPKVGQQQNQNLGAGENFSQDSLRNTSSGNTGDLKSKTNATSSQGSDLNEIDENVEPSDQRAAGSQKFNSNNNPRH